MKSCKLSFLERVFFDIESYLENKIRIMEYKTKDTQVFRSFFDQSMGIMITSKAHQREIEKKHGVTYMSNDERISATKEAKMQVASRKSIKRKKDIKNIFENVERGHSYIDDMKKRGL